MGRQPHKEHMHQPPRHNDAHRFFKATKGDFRLGLVCPATESEQCDSGMFASSFSTVLDLAEHSGMDGGLPQMHVLACCGHVPPEQSRRVTEQRIARYSDVTAMLAAHPDINLVLELTGCPDTLRILRQTVPLSVALLDWPCTAFLSCLLRMRNVSGQCKSDLRGSRNVLSKIVDELPDDIFFLDTRGRIVDMNRRVRERHGMDKQALHGLESSMVPPAPGQVPCGPESGDWPVSMALAHQQEAGALQTWMDEQGRVHSYQVNAYPVFDEEGQVYRVIEVRRDVTLRTEMEKRLQQAEKLAAIGELSTYIAHEIRNPLFAIGGFANSLLRSRELSENSRDKVRIIMEESKRLDQVLKNVINFARPITSKLAEMDVNHLVAETIQVLGIGCEERGVVLEVRLGDDVPKVLADVEQLKQCMINLVRNALEAMPEGGRLTVSTAMERHRVRVTVADNGPGIPVELQDKVFNPFFTTKQVASGAGLGLAMTRKIITDLGGDLLLRSRPGEGTQVTLHLQPYVAVDESTPGDSGGE